MNAASETMTTKCQQCGEAMTYEPASVWGLEFKPTACDVCSEAYEAKRTAEAREKAEAERIGRFKELCPSGKWSIERERYPAMLEKLDQCLAHDLTERGLLIHGVSRIGKSLTAWQLCRRWVEAGRSVRVLRDVEFGRLIERSYSESSGAHDRLIGELCRVPLLFIDDLGKSKMTARVETDLFDVIDHRYESGRPMLVTTQFTGNTLANRFSCQETGVGVLERLRESCAAVNLRRAKKVAATPVQSHVPHLPLTEFPASA